MRPVWRRGCRVVPAVALTAVLAACGGTRRPASPDAVDRPLERDSLLASLHAFGRSFGASRAEIASRLGTPDSIRTRVQPNVHVAGALDTAIVLRYPSMRFTLLRPGPTARDLLIAATVWEAGATVAPGVRLGATAWRTLDTALGPSAGIERMADTTIVTYLWPPTDAEEAVRLHFVRDTLHVVSWGFYFD